MASFLVCYGLSFCSSHSISLNHSLSLFVIYQMKADILRHIPMKYGADWCMNSKKLQHNYCDGFIFGYSILYQVKITNKVYFAFFKFVICLHQDIKMLGKTIFVFISRHMTLKNAYW